MVTSSSLSSINLIYTIDGVHFFHPSSHDGWVQEQNGLLKIAAGACYGKTPSETGYNLVRIQGREVKVWLRCFDKVGQGWIPNILHNKTGDDGCWRMTLPHDPFTPTAPARPESLRKKPEPSTFAPDSLEAQGLYGRERDLEKLLELLKTKPIASLYGVPGIGKTWLARAVGRRLHPDSTAPILELTMHRELGVDDLYRQLAAALGNRDDDPQLPRDVLRNPKFDEFAQHRQRAEPRLLHLCKAHELFDGGRWRDAGIGALLAAIAKHYPQIRILLESAQLPPEGLLKEHGSLKLLGLARDALRGYFRQPFGSGDPRGWELDAAQTDNVFHALEDRHKLGKQKEARAHPLGMKLLALLADGLGQNPAQVLEQHPGKLHDELRQELFDSLYRRVLSPPQQHILRLCSLYREAIPDGHVEALNRRVGNNDAFDQLKQRLLLSPDAREERYELHQLFAQLAQSYLEPGRETRQDHAVVAGCWLQPIKGVTRRSLPNILAAGEAAHHLLEAGDYRRLEQLSHGLLGQDTAARLAKISLSLHTVGNHEDNRRVLALLVVLQPDNPKAHRFLGEAIEHLEGRGHEQALNHYREAHRLSPHFPACLSDLGRCLLARNEAAEFVALVDAMPPTQQAQAVNDHVWAIYCQGLEKLQRGADASATRLRLIAARSRNAAFYADEALYQAEQGQTDKALALLELAEHNHAADDHTRAIQARLLEQTGRGEEASRLRQRCIAQGSRNAAFYTDEALYLAEQGQTDKALALLELAEHNHAANDHTRAIQARLLEQVGRGEEASRLRRRWIEQGSRHAAFYADEALYLEKRGDVPAAVELLRQAQRLGCNNEVTENILRRLLTRH